MSGIANVMIAAIERRYDLPSTLAALVPASYEVIAALACIPVTYYATNAHKPRILTFSPLLLSAGSFIMTIPHWAVGPYQLGKSISDTCVIGGRGWLDFISIQIFNYINGECCGNASNNYAISSISRYVI